MKKNKIKLFNQENRKEIIYNLINSLLAGALVFLGTLLDGDLTLKGVLIAVITFLIVAITKFKEYWDGEASEYCKSLVNFI
jgi:hypothetical protein